MAIFGYARVSPDDQSLDAQVAALKAAGAFRIFRETVSGARAERPELARAIRALGSGDALLVTRLEHLARSTRDLLKILNDVAKAGAEFQSLSDTWADTTTPQGRLLLMVLGGLAEFERDLVRARTGEGRKRARTRGVHMGRPSSLTPHQRREAMAALAAGKATQADLARQYKVAQSTISRLADKQASAAVSPALDGETERAAQAFMRRLEGRYPVREALLYGSRARGDHTPDSDADLAVILQGQRGDRAAAVKDMAGIAFHVMMETGVMVEAMPLWEDEIEHPERFTNPALISNILRDGVRL